MWILGGRSHPPVLRNFVGRDRFRLANPLSIESGAFLNTGSCNVYYVHVTGSGMVDDPANLRQIVILPGDGDGDGQVNLWDHRSFADCLTGPAGGLL